MYLCIVDLLLLKDVIVTGIIGETPFVDGKSKVKVTHIRDIRGVLADNHLCSLSILRTSHDVSTIKWLRPILHMFEIVFFP